MAKYDPDVPTEWTFESFWQADIDRARTSDSHDAQRDARNVMRECIRFLKGNGFVFKSTNWDKRIPISEKGYPPKGYLPEPLCSFLIESLEAAMQAKSKQVGKAMRIGGLPIIDVEYQERLNTFRNYFGRLMSSHSDIACTDEDIKRAKDGTVNTEREVRAMVLEEIASIMKVELRTVQRYYKDAGGPSILDFGFNYEVDPYEDEEE